MKHDKEITEYFENRGWTVIRIWECELKNKKALEKLKMHLLRKDLIYSDSRTSRIIWNSI